MLLEIDKVILLSNDILCFYRYQKSIKHYPKVEVEKLRRENDSLQNAIDTFESAFEMKEKEIEELQKQIEEFNLEMEDLAC